MIEGALLNLDCCILFNLTWGSFIIYIVHSMVDESCGTFIGVFICLLCMVKPVLVNVAMHTWSHSCSTEINVPAVICRNT